MDTVATLRGYETLPKNDYAAVMSHLATVGPLAVSGKQTAEKCKQSSDFSKLNTYLCTFLCSYSGCIWMEFI